MASFFKRFKKNIPTSTTSKGSTYYKRESIIGNFDDLKTVLEAAPDMPASKTTEEITFNNLPLKSITFAEVKKKYGNPAYIHDNEHIEGHKVLFYKEGVAYYKFLIQYHFIDNNFFFAANKISSMGVLKDSDKKKIIGRISKKYFNDDLKDSEDWQMKVVDPSGSIIHTFDDVYFHLFYLAGNDTTQQLIKRYSDHKPKSVSPSGFKESLDQYI